MLSNEETTPTGFTSETLVPREFGGGRGAARATPVSWLDTRFTPPGPVPRGEPPGGPAAGKGKTKGQPTTTNKKLVELIEGLVNEFCAANGLNPLPGQKGGDREEGNVMVGRAIKANMGTIRGKLGLPAPAEWSEPAAEQDAA